MSKRLCAAALAALIAGTGFSPIILRADPAAYSAAQLEEAKEFIEKMEKDSPALHDKLKKAAEEQNVPIEKVFLDAVAAVGDDTLGKNSPRPNVPSQPGTGSNTPATGSGGDDVRPRDGQPSTSPNVPGTGSGAGVTR
ncbi:MAG: hypothetical protein NW217_02060 [Hyphomicrobiaceae bacterium]|nr:hypothetical protein [Hyphomicrobiaceae bacterium]